MRQAQLPNPNKIMAVWASSITLLALIVGVYTLLLHNQVDAMRQSSPWTYLKKAEELRKQNNTNAALRMLQRATELDAASPLPHERAGLIYYEMKNWASALASYQQALALGSKEVDARGKMIWCFVHLDRPLEGAEFGEGCIQAGTSTAVFPRYVAHAYRLAGKLDKAIEYYEAARRKEPNDLTLIERLVELYTRTGRPENAAALQQRVTDLESSY